MAETGAVDPSTNNVTLTFDQLSELIQQAVQTSSQQAASQVAQQIAEQVSQQISQAVSKLISAQAQQDTVTGTMQTGKSIYGEIPGGLERLEKDATFDSSLMAANMKRTYDEYQDTSLVTLRQLNNVALQALQNAVETANMIGKQAVRHGDVAIDGQWSAAAKKATATT